MNQILRCDWLPKRARWRYLARSGLHAVPQEKILPPNKRKPCNKSFIDQACSVKMAGYWPRSLFCLFVCVFMVLDSVSVQKHEKIELGHYPAILTSHLGNCTFANVTPLKSSWKTFYLGRLSILKYNSPDDKQWQIKKFKVFIKKTCSHSIRFLWHNPFYFDFNPP